MSTIEVDNFKDRTSAKTIGASYVTDGVAKAFCNINGTGTIAIRGDSLNHSSLTDEGTGAYLVTLASAMGDANFTTFDNHAPAFPISTSNNNAQGFCTAQSTTTLRHRSLEGNGTTNRDSAYVGSMVMGDLA